MKKKYISCDKTEIVLVLKGKKATIVHLTYEDIKRIEISPFEEKTLFKKVPSEKIEIFTPKNLEPYVFTKLKYPDHFDEYKSDLKKFSDGHHLTFHDQTED